MRDVRQDLAEAIPEIQPSEMLAALETIVFSGLVHVVELDGETIAAVIVGDGGGWTESRDYDLEGP